MRPDSTRLPSVTLLVAIALTCTAARAQAPGAAAAEALFQEGRDALKRGDLETACARLRASFDLDPAPGTKLNLADCEEQRGRVATAWEAFRAALEKLPPGDSRAAVATTRIRELAGRLPHLVLTLAPGAPEDTVVKDGGVVFARSTFGVSLPLDPGIHHLIVTAPGRTARRYDVILSEARETRLTIEPGIVEAGPRSSAPVAQVAVPVEASAPASSLSHAGQLGAVLRADIDGLRAGVIAAPGLSYGIGDYVEVSACGLIGKNKGLEPGATVLLLRGAWKPLLLVGVPIVFPDGARAAVHAAAGVQWDPLRHFGVFAMLGTTVLFTVPENYQRASFVPSIGVQGRL